jgi:hypothetical protein
VGTLLLVVGMITSSFASAITTLYITYGLISGKLKEFIFCLIEILSIVTLNLLNTCKPTKLQNCQYKL